MLAEKSFILPPEAENAPAPPITPSTTNEMPGKHISFAVLALVSFIAANAHAKVTRIEITSRAEVAGGRAFGLAGAYEKIIGKAHFAVDPNDPRNRVIVDVDKAPRNARGEVEFSADLYILKPKDPNRSNGSVLMELPNRGRKLMLPTFQHAASSFDPTNEAELGDAFLLRQGFTLVWIGWQFDAPLQAGLMRLYAPTATDNGKVITGLVRADYVFGAKTYDASVSERNHIAYPVLDPQSAENVLTARETALGERRVIPRSEWKFARTVDGKLTPDSTHIHLKTGFEPGKIYELIYRSYDPKVVGLGLAAARDIASYLKHQSDAVVTARRAYAFGASQSGRFLRHFLYQGFNADEANRQVFDGMFIHVAGAGRGSFNHRFAQPSRDGQPFQSLFYPTDIFPFSDREQTDAETGVTDGLLTHAQKQPLPKIFYTNSSHEYWGRCASLIQTTIDGKADIELMENSRVYLFAGGQHGPGPFPPVYNPEPEYLGQQRLNPNDFTWAMRALLVALERWVKDGAPPPPSQYPRIADGTLVRPDDVAFPKLPGVGFPRGPKDAFRVDYGPQFKQGVISLEPPRIGKPFPILATQVDRDGNERAGIRMPEIAAPLATYTGWNLRDPKIGAPRELSRLSGSYIPFARTRAERERAGDPRLSIEERYQNRAHYLGLFAEAALRLIKDGYLLAEDLPALLNRAGEHWDFATK